MEPTATTQQPAPAATPAPVQQSVTQPTQQVEISIPKHRFDEVNQLYKDAEARVAQLQQELEAVKGKDAEIAKLKKELEDQRTAFETEKANAKKELAIEAAIKDKTVDADIVKKLLDLSKITVDEKDGLKGLDEQIKTLQTDKPYLWKKPEAKVPKSTTPPPKASKSFAQQLGEKKVKALGITAKAKNYF